MKYSIRFGACSIALLVLKQQELEVGSLLGINIPYCLWQKNSMFNISRFTHGRNPIFENTWIYLPTFDRVEKIFSWSLWGRNIPI